MWRSEDICPEPGRDPLSGPHLKVGYAAVTATEGREQRIRDGGGCASSVWARFGTRYRRDHGAIGLDIATFLPPLRLVSHTAAYYGYTHEGSGEKLCSRDGFIHLRR